MKNGIIGVLLFILFIYSAQLNKVNRDIDRLIWDYNNKEEVAKCYQANPNLSMKDSTALCELGKPANKKSISEEIIDLIF